MVQHPYFLGIEIGGTKLQFVIGGDLPGFSHHLLLEVDQAGGAGGIRDQIRNSLIPFIGDKVIAATGIGFGGPVNYKTGTINTSHQIHGWKDFDLVSWLRGITGSPVFIDNDANVAALGEAIHGAGSLFRNVFYMTIGSGIGGGVVIDGNIYHGAHPGEVEIGHVRLNKNGDTLESLCSGWAIDKKIRDAIARKPESILAGLVGHVKKKEAMFLKDALEKNDQTAMLIVDEAAGDIAFALSHVVHLFHPEVIILGGGLSLLGEDLRRRVAAALTGYIMKSFLPGPEIKIAMLGEKVVPAGAVELAKASLLKTS